MASEGELSRQVMVLSEGGMVVRETSSVVVFSLYAGGMMRLLVRSVRRDETRMYRVQKVAFPQKNKQQLQLPSPV